MQRLTLFVGLIAVCVAGAALSLAWAQPAHSDGSEAAQDDPTGPASLSLVRTLTVPSALPLEDPDAVPPQHGLDTYVDWDLGTATQFHDSGAMSTVPLTPNWVFRSAHIQQKGLYAMCMQRKTGATFFMDDGEWSPIDETEGDAALVGDYDLVFEVAASEAYAMRFDRYTGRSWLLDNDKWSPIPGNLDGWPAASEASRDEGR